MKIPGKPGGERVIPSFMIKEQYLMEYWELMSRFQDVNVLRMKGHKNGAIVGTRVYRRYLAVLVSLSEKLRPKIEKDKKYKTKYSGVPDAVNKFYREGFLDFSTAINCMKMVSNYFEEAGFTDLDVHNVKPEDAVLEW